MIYVDNNATSPSAPEVVEAIQPYLTSEYGNPSSIHRMGQEARKAMDAAREKVAAFLGVKHDSEIIFTSGGTESNNLAIMGYLESQKDSDARRRHLITSKVEHPSVLNVFKLLERRGYRVTYIGADQEGLLNLDLLKREISRDTALVSLMAANNETGVLFPVEEVGHVVKNEGAIYHVDAVQAAGRIPLNLRTSCIDFLSVSGHKIHAGKGAGALYMRKGVPLAPLITGGSQERGRRGGTENVAAVVAMGVACELAVRDFAPRNERLRFLRNKLESSLLQRVPGTLLNGCRDGRVSNTTNISFEGLESESILLALSEEGICASSGSACSTGSIELSHVLLAMGHSEERVRSAIRFSLSRYNREDEIDVVLDKVPSILSRLRSIQAMEV